MLEEVNRLIDDVNNSVDDVREDLEVRKRLATILIVEYFTKMTSWFSLSFLWVLMLFGLSLLIHISAAFYLGDLWDNMALGFLTASGIYLVVSIILLFVIRRRLLNELSENLIKMFLDE